MLSPLNEKHTHTETHTHTHFHLYFPWQNFILGSILTSYTYLLYLLPWYFSEHLYFNCEILKTGKQKFSFGKDFNHLEKALIME